MKIKCHICGKPVTSEINGEIIFRGVAECPECIQKQNELTKPKSIKERIKENSTYFIDVAEGKYSIYQDKSGSLKALRYGLPWRDLEGDNLIYNMMVELIDAKEELKINKKPPSVTFHELNKATKIINDIEEHLKGSRCSKESLRKIINGDIQ